MGAGCCKLATNDTVVESRSENKLDQLRKPRWVAQEPRTLSQIQAMRDQFWDTEPHYGGDRVIWDALKAAAEADIDSAKLVLASAGVIVAKRDMTVCYDELGRMYCLPKYVLSLPTNLSAKVPPPSSELSCLTAMAQ